MNGEAYRLLFTLTIDDYDDDKYNDNDDHEFYKSHRLINHV